MPSGDGVAGERHQGDRMPLTRAVDILEGRAAVPHRSFGCTACGEDIQETVTGCRRLASGQYVCSDCYFEHFDKIETTPIMSPRIRRRG